MWLTIPSVQFPSPLKVSYGSFFLFRWVFKQLYDKGLVYRGVKVMPFSTACNTPLSNFESHQNYKVGTNQPSQNSSSLM